MLIEILTLLLCIAFLLAFLYERNERNKNYEQLKAESNELDKTRQISDSILRNVHAFILFIDSDFKVLKTNYYTLTGTIESIKDKRVGDLLHCANAMAAINGCGTHELCGHCPVRHTIQHAFDTKTSFQNLNASLNIENGKDILHLDAVVSGSYIVLDKVPHMVLTIHDVTELKQTQKELAEIREVRI